MISKRYLKLGLHDSIFHLDDILCFAMVRYAYPDMEIELHRTRDEEVLRECDIVADVGGGEYDHHFPVDKKQKDPLDNIPYSACHLLWNDYDETIIKNVLQEETEERIKNIPEPKLDFIKDYVVKTLLKQVDVFDNGYDLKPYSGQQNFKTTNISNIVSMFNNVEDGFNKAVDVVLTVLSQTILNAAKQYEIALDINEALFNRQEYLELEEYAPVNGILYSEDTSHQIKFFIFKHISGTYRLQTVQVTPEDRTPVKALPTEWWGKSAEELNQLIDIKDSIFCHNTGFLIGTESKESIYKVLDIALGKPHLDGVRNNTKW